MCVCVCVCMCVCVCVCVCIILGDSRHKTAWIYFCRSACTAPGRQKFWKVPCIVTFYSKHTRVGHWLFRISRSKTSACFRWNRRCRWRQTASLSRRRQQSSPLCRRHWRTCRGPRLPVGGKDVRPNLRSRYPPPHMHVSTSSYAARGWQGREAERALKVGSLVHGSIYIYMYIYVYVCIWRWLHSAKKHVYDCICIVYISFFCIHRSQWKKCIKKKLMYTIYDVYIHISYTSVYFFCISFNDFCVSWVASALFCFLRMPSCLSRRLPACHLSLPVYSPVYLLY